MASKTILAAMEGFAIPGSSGRTFKHYGYYKKCVRVWAEDGKNYSNEDLTLIASQAKPFGAIIDTDDPIFNAQSDFRQKLHSIVIEQAKKPPESDGEIVRSTFRSLALKYRFTF